MRAVLRPKTSLRRGEPKQAAMLMPGLPARAIATSVTKSPMELPMASTVNPRIPAVHYTVQ